MKDYLNIGRSVGTYLNMYSDRILVKYNKNGINSLAEKNPQIGQILEDVFVGCSNPQLEFVSKKVAKHNFLDMITKDGNDVITRKQYILPVEEDIRNYIPEDGNRIIKIVLDKSSVDKIKTQDDDFARYISDMLKPEEHPYFTREELEDFIKRFPDYSSGYRKYLKDFENPVMEIAMKKGDKYSVHTVVLKDGDSVITKGAYSESKDKKGRMVRKYHFTDYSHLYTGYKSSDKSRFKTEDIFPKELLDKYIKIGGVFFSERTNDFLKQKFGLEGNKMLTYDQIAEKWQLSKERVMQIFHKVFRRLESWEFTPEQLEAYKANKNNPRYLNKRETEEFIAARNLAMYDDASESEYGMSKLKYWNDVNESRRNIAINNAINDIHESVIPKDTFEFKSIDGVCIL